MVPEGGDVVVASALRSASPLAWYPAGASAVLRCDDFRIDYRADGSVRQFYSDVSGARPACVGLSWARLPACLPACSLERPLWYVIQPVHSPSPLAPALFLPPHLALNPSHLSRCLVSPPQSWTWMAASCRARRSA